MKIRKPNGHQVPTGFDHPDVGRFFYLGTPLIKYKVVWGGLSSDPSVLKALRRPDYTNLPRVEEAQPVYVAVAHCPGKWGHDLRVWHAQDRTDTYWEDTDVVIADDQYALMA